MKLDLQNEFKIKYSAVLPLSSCDILKPHLLTRYGLGEEGSVLLFLVPYFTKRALGGNISCYAAGRDYHAFFSEISEKLKKRLSELLPEKKFVSFADHSPINEKLAAASAGLGVIGNHSLLINPEYSSFIFIGGIYSEISVCAWKELLSGTEFPEKTEIRHCSGCKKCERSCPASCISADGGIDPVLCLSAISQKKSLTKEEEDAMTHAPFIWGCDVCQLVCPMTENAIRNGTIETPFDEFREDLIPNIDKDLLDELTSSGEFERRAFSWRGSAVLYRNLKLKYGETEK